MKFKPQVLVCLFLVLATLLCATGCGENKPDAPANTTDSGSSSVIGPGGEVTGGEDDPFLNYPELIGVRDYAMEPLIIATVETDPTTYFVLSSNEDITTGSKVNEAMYNRDKAMSELYGIDVQYLLYPSDDGGTLRQQISNSITGNLYVCDIIASCLSNSLLNLATLGNLYNIHDLPTVSMDNPWWASYFSDGATFQNTLYYGASMAVGGGYFATVYSMVGNLALANTVTLEDGTQLDLLSVVDSGNWTIEMMLDIITDFTQDLNGDEVIDPLTDKMAYAHVNSGITAGCHFIAAGGKFNTFDTDGNIVVDLGSESAENLVESLTSLFAEISTNRFEDDNQIRSFLGNRALFFGNSMSYANRLTEMTSDYAIIPCPKGSADQDQYFSGINTWTPGFIGFAANLKDADFVGYAVEILGYNSYYRVKPIVYDETLCLRLARDPRQIAIMDEIYANLYIDINYLNDFATSARVVQTCIMDASKNYSSSYQKVEKALPLIIDQFVKGFDKG